MPRASQPIALDPEQIRPALGRLGALAEGLAGQGHELRRRLGAAQAGDPRGHLRGGVEAGYTGARAALGAEAALCDLLRNTALTLDQLSQADQQVGLTPLPLGATSALGASMTLNFMAPPPESALSGESPAGDELGQLLDDAAALVRELWGAAGQELEQLWRDVEAAAETVETALAQALADATPLLLEIGATLEQLAGSLVGQLQALVETLNGAVRDYFASVLEIYQALYDFFASDQPLMQKLLVGALLLIVGMALAGGSPLIIAVGSLAFIALQFKEVRRGLFKVWFDHYLPRKLIDHYIDQRRETVRLSLQEMLDCNPVIDVTDTRYDRTFDDSLRQLQASGGGVRYISFKTAAGAMTNGTLGNFTVANQGRLRVFADGSWEYQGTASFIDRYDFDPHVTNDRSQSGELKTRIASWLLPGVPFDIRSETIRIAQKHMDEEASFPDFPTYVRGHHNDWFALELSLLGY